MKEVKQFFCKHEFVPVTKINFENRISSWDVASQSWKLEQFKDGGYTLMLECRCGKTKEEFYK
jgi:hypothetical protein